MAKYIALSTAVTDELYFSDGTHYPSVAGGAGIYALAGMLVWHENATIVTGVGADYHDLYGQWYEKNHIATEGLLVKDPHTPHTVIRYLAEDDRTETPRYGDDHYLKVAPSPGDLAQFCQDATGVYVFRNANPNFWQGILSLKKEHGFTLMWEIANDCTRVDHLEQVEAIAKNVDVFSINAAEAKSLFGVATLEQAVTKLHAWNLPMVYLRVGSKGAYALSQGTATLVPSVPNCTVVDVTGGGNSSSGGALVGYCETKDAVLAAKMGNVAASFIIGQYGVPDTMDAALRQQAKTRLEGLC